MKAIENYPGYWVTREGRIYHGKYTKRIEVQRHVDKDTGRMYVELSNGQLFYVQFLVAQAFLSNPRKRKAVRHKEGKNKSNHVDGLEWV